MIVTLLSIIRRFDMFGEPVAQFNIKGDTVVKTGLGGFVSIAVWAILLSFAYVRALKMNSRDEPFIYEVS
jgi:hypothetical protein